MISGTSNPRTRSSDYELIKSHILVVDDDEPIRLFFKQLLDRHGFQVSTAKSGLEALKVLDRTQVNLIILDVMMPELDGFKTLEEIRQRYSQVDLPVIINTSLNDRDHVIKAMRLGANDFLGKPVQSQVALARIRSLLTLTLAERARQESEQRFDLAARGARDGLWDWNLSTDEVFFSVRWKEMLGYDPKAIGSDPDEWFERIHPDDKARVKDQLDRHLQGETPIFTCEYRIKHQAGNYLWVFCRGNALRVGNRAYRIAGSQSDITYQSLHDTLTGLPKRELFLNSLMRAAERPSGERTTGFAVLYLDLVKFKRINDSCGYEAGDQTLIEIMHRIESCISSEDTLARLEGGDFVILRNYAETMEEAYLLAKNIQTKVSEPINISGQQVNIEVAIAIVMGKGNLQKPNELLQNAHTALFHAKGKAAIVTFDKMMRNHAIEKVQLETHLRNALARSELSLYYQPQVDLSNEEVIGLEVLLRWHSKELGWILPDKFIPVAEETGLIVPIGEWVIRNAFKQANAWKRAGFKPIKLAVNFSAKQFSQLDLVAKIRGFLQEMDYPAELFEVEITESIIMENIQMAAATMNRLHSLGINISVDDFGTGYSSMEYLKRFPLDSLKIDKSFIQAINGNQGDTITAAIIAMAKVLKIAVIAEGVESADQIRFLREKRCDIVQGGYYSLPVPANKVVEYLIRRN